jgi:hypothetical protein
MALEMSSPSFDFETMKSKYISRAETSFSDECVKQQADIEVHISGKMRVVLDKLKGEVVVQLTEARASRLGTLETIREQIRQKAERKLTVVQRQFVNKA